MQLEHLNLYFRDKYVADIEAVKCISQLNGYLIVLYQIVMTYFIFPFDLIDNHLGITIGFLVLQPHFPSKLEADK